MSFGDSPMGRGGLGGRVKSLQPSFLAVHGNHQNGVLESILVFTVDCLGPVFFRMLVLFVHRMKPVIAPRGLRRADSWFS